MATVPTALDVPMAQRNVQSTVTAAVRRYPDKIALRDLEGASLTYASLWEGALAAGGGFRKLGVGRQEYVLLMLDNHADFILAWLGLCAIAAVEVPVNTAYKGVMLSYIANNSGARTMVIDDRYCGRLAAVAGELKSLQTVVVRGGKGADLPQGRFRVIPWEEVANAKPVEAEPVNPWDLVAVMYTSGTTGPSKGVMVPHAHGFVYCHPGRSGVLDPDDVTMCNLPLFHIGGQWAAVYSAFIKQGGVVVFDRFRATTFWEDVRKYGCTSVLLLGARANFLYRQPPRDDDAQNPLRYVSMVPVIPEVEDFARRFGVVIGTGYGLTEGASPLAAPLGEVVPGGCGRLGPGWEARLVDEHDMDVKPGEVGELLLRPKEPWMTMAGYHGMPEKTAEAFRNLWLHTGDALYQDETGQFFFVDRRKDAIRRRGENVSSFEVESAVNSHPAVLESAAIAVPSEHTEDDIKVVVVLKPGAKLDYAEFIRYLVDRMPYFMVPRYVEVVNEIPKTPTEKMRKEELRKAGITPGTWDREAAGIKVTRDG